jgi:hypothetical protein
MVIKSEMVSNNIGVNCKQNEQCTRPISGGEMEVNEGELSEVEGVVNSSEPEFGIN